MEQSWEQVLAFWFGDDLQREWPEPQYEKRWFGGGAALDRDITARFGAGVESAMRGGLAPWEGEPLSRLALMLLLDQFTRNVFRGQGCAFDGDARAVALVEHGLDAGMDRALPWAGRVFFYMPLMHAEDMARQQRCIDCFERACMDAPPAVAERLEGNLRFARDHADIIARYGRFPYRNKVLGRANTPEEEAFLAHGPSYGQ